MELNYHPEVKQALAEGRAVVALESTIISHGLPYPQNLATAKQLAETVAEQGAVAATIAILDGQVKIGLTHAELERIADPHQQVEKVSRRDLPTVCIKKQHGATTVAATMFLAEKAGISIFATGGIGGVHRGAETNFDISADLTELRTTNVAVVSAGPKAILDLNLTLETLETYGVPVIGYGVNELPAFWSRQSGLQLHQRLDTAYACAAVADFKWQAGLTGGVLFMNPIPAEAEIEKSVIDIAIADALAHAHSQAISGKAVTPFLLKHIRQITKDRTLDANIALVLNNAQLAGQIASELSRIRQKRS